MQIQFETKIQKCFIETQKSFKPHLLKLIKQVNQLKIILEILEQTSLQYQLQNRSKQYALKVFVSTIRTKSLVVDQETTTNTSQNKYSIYFPIRHDINIHDEYCNAFPILKIYKDTFQIYKKTDIFNEITTTLLKYKDEFTDKKEGLWYGWRICLKRWIWEIDLQKVLYLYQLFLKLGYGIITWIKKKNNEYLDISVIFYKMMEISRILKNHVSIQRNLRISVQTQQEINETTIVKTTKQLFCPACFVYDCDRHKFEDSIIQEQNIFVHPKNKILYQTNLDMAKSISKFYQNIKKRIPNKDNSQQIRCSSNCYLDLTATSYRLLQYQRFILLSPVVKSLLKLGIQMFSYNPCYIFTLVKGRTSCALIFFYLIQQYGINQRLMNKLKDPTTHLEQQSSNLMDDKKIDYLKKKKKMKENFKHQKNASNATPLCYHSFLNKQAIQDVNCENCTCNQRGFCIPSCHCDISKCLIMRIGCQCQKDCKIRNCNCYSRNLQCDPSICQNCFRTLKNRDEKIKFNQCTNNQFLRFKFPKLKVGESTLPGGGLGAFTRHKIKKNTLVILYNGELIQTAVQSLRQIVSQDLYFYNFAFREVAIDAKYFGNISRFVNHDNQEKENTKAIIMFSGADYFLGFYSVKDISQGEELFADYDGEGNLYKNYANKYPFIKPKKK